MMRLFQSSFIILMMLFLCPASVFARSVILGGQSIGLELVYDGVYVVGTYDIELDGKVYNPASHDIIEGDVITAINDISIATIDELATVMQSQVSQGNSISLSLLRDGVMFKRDIDVLNIDGTMKTGLYVKDTTLGVGTLTYIDPQNDTFGALGHSLNEISYDLSLNDGQVYASAIKDIIINSKSKTGEKIATIYFDDSVGIIAKNSTIGVFGQSISSTQGELIEIANKEDISLGKAYIYTVLNGNTIEAIECEIVDLANQSEALEKGITIKITDANFLSRTNGIIQGMSGSPIVQDDRLVGALSHVNKQDYTIGYGVYIEWMLEESDSLK